MSEPSRHDYEYSDHLKQVLDWGERRSDRTGVGTIGVFGDAMHFRLEDEAGFPLLTTKRVHWKSVVHELLWFVRGETNTRYLEDNGVTIWNEWKDENGDLGPVYGKQWRSWESADGRVHDQLMSLIERLKTDPYSRRHVISAWNVGELEQMALPPCHSLFQFWVSAEDNSLHCQLYMRSCDLFLGCPFNLASYALLTCILADTLGFKRGSFHQVIGDAHVYVNHLDQVNEQLSRAPRPAPRLLRIEDTDPLAVTFDDVKLVDYDPWPAIKAPVAV